MNEIVKHNKAKWEELAQADVEYSRPWLHLDPRSARKRLDPNGWLGEVAGKNVLCLASGGGQQSAAFSVLGASVTVLDVTETQLQRDREAAEHYGVSVLTFQGDMCDLSRFEDDTFDVVWHPYSIDFIPDCRPVFREVSRVLRVGGRYYMQWHNPFIKGLDETDWNGDGFSLRHPYTDGEVLFPDMHWEFDDSEGGIRRVEGPREFRHTFSTVFNTLAECGFVILGVDEKPSGTPNAAPGSWEHLITLAPRWLSVWMVYRPDIFNTTND